MKKSKSIGLAIVLMLVAIAIAAIPSVILALLICWVWNGWVVAAFAAPILPFWVAFVVLWLLSCLFGIKVKSETN